MVERAVSHAPYSPWRFVDVFYDGTLVGLNLTGIGTSMRSLYDVLVYKKRVDNKKIFSRTLKPSSVTCLHSVGYIRGGALANAL